MKATGIIRRIDELGRIVVPKEIRKTLRIKEGESLEIYIEGEDIVLKKYSLIKKLNDFAQDLVDSIYMYIKHTVIITDNDTILAVAGSVKKEYMNKLISPSLGNMIFSHNEIVEHSSKKTWLTQDKSIESAYIFKPILINGDAVGSIIILGDGELDYKVCQIASQFLSNHLNV